MNPSPSPRNHNGSHEKPHPDRDGNTSVCPQNVPMKSNLSVIRELNERPKGQILSINIPGLTEEKFLEFLLDPEVISWALAMPRERRDAVIQQAIDEGKCEVINIYG